MEGMMVVMDGNWIRQAGRQDGNWEALFAGQSQATKARKDTTASALIGLLRA